MTDSKHFETSPDSERWVRAGFQIQDPDDLFINRLHKELIEKYNDIHNTTPKQSNQFRRLPWIDKVKPALSSLAWGLITIFLIFSLIWGIKTLVPRGAPASNISPSPSLSPKLTQQHNSTATSPYNNDRLTVLIENDLNCDNATERSLRN